MSLDVRFTERRTLKCPHCGEAVDTINEYTVDSGGRGWYQILEDLGYYVPYEQRTEENDWYGQDMVLTKEQAVKVRSFVKKHMDLYQANEILGLISYAILDENDVVLNADW